MNVIIEKREKYFILHHLSGIIPMNARDLEEALEMGMDWSLREGYVWAEDKVNERTNVFKNSGLTTSFHRNTARNTAAC